MGEIYNLGNLSGKVLIATPSLDESIFEHALVFVCAHDEEGAIGVIFNKPKSIITTREILNKFSLKRRFKLNKKYIIYTGGPVEEGSLFVLSASADFTSQLTLYGNADTFLFDVVNGKDMGNFILCSGFCGWGAGQLEKEIGENSWIVADVDFKTIFAGNPVHKWGKLVKKLGIKNLDRLVPYSGNA
jgi:putative transcriptional regulator